MPDQSLPMPGGPLPSSDVVVPYNGGKNKVVISPEAQVAQKAANEFTRSFDGFQGPNRKHNVLDAATQANLDELVVLMRQNRPKPATVINLHPFELQFNADNYLLRGHTVPACEPGMPYNYKAIRGWRHDGGSYNEDGSRKFKAILPIDVAGQFVREFNKNESYGPGVLIYLGDINPDKVGQVEVYDQMGRLITTEGEDFDFDEEDRKIPIKVRNPVFRSFTDLLKETRLRRNAFYLKRVKEAEAWVKKGEKFAPFVQNTHILMAQVLAAEKVIPAVPVEITGMATREQRGIAEENCPACQRPVQKGAYKCEHCSNILDALGAFLDGAIEFEHAKIGLLPEDKYAQAEKVNAKRQKRLAKRNKVSEKKQGKQD